MTSSSGQAYYKISCSFERDFKAPIREGLVTAGRFLFPAGTDVSSAVALTASSTPKPALSLACASSGQRVIIHNNNTHAAAARRSAKRGEQVSAPSNGDGGSFESEEAALHTLNFGKEATALAAGRLSVTASSVALRAQDALLFGAETSLLAYNADQNKQVFYKEVEDGVQAVVWGEVSAADSSSLLTVVGGNCSVYGFDSTGTERYWTVTGDQVTAMAMVPWSTASGPSAGAPALLAASEDFEIRMFNGEEAMCSVMEVDRVRQLVPHCRASPTIPGEAPANAVASCTPGRFAYLLDNGTVGVYNKTERVWRVKGKSVPVSAAFCDIDCDGVDELIVGWRNGRVEVRSDLRAGSGNKGGEVLFRETYAAPVAAVLAEDYREDGRVLPIVCTVDGTVRGLTLLESQLEEAVDVREAQTLEALLQEKQTLNTQLSLLEEQLALKQNGEEDATMPETGLAVSAGWLPNMLTHKLDLILSVHNGSDDVIIHSCVLFSDTTGLLVGEDGTAAFYAETPSNRLVCSLELPNDVAATIRASVVVGTHHAESYQIHEVFVALPKFVMYQLPIVLRRQNPVLTSTYVTPSGYVTLTFREPLCMPELEAWLRETFSLAPDCSLSAAAYPTAPVLLLELLSVRDGSSLSIEAHNAGTGENTITVRADTMDVCGNIVTAMEAALTPTRGVAQQGAAPISVRCEFPKEMVHLRDVLKRVEELNEARMKLTADMADAAMAIKLLLIRAEDARLLGDIANMKKTYVALNDLDRELLGENAKRVSNYDELKGALKEVNSYIQRAGKMRMGPAKAELITACRAALKANKITSLVELIRTGLE